MTKLHEILAVESSAEKTANKLIKESLRTLDKENLFSGQVRRLEMFREEDKNAEVTEYQELTTTVDENIDYLVNPISNWLDVCFSKDSTNQLANADIVIKRNGFEHTIATNVPATFLLGLESKLTKIRELYEAIPTLAPGISWVKDVQDREGVYRAEHDSIQLKTRKDPEFRVVYEATDHHPAQIAEVARVADIGRYVTTIYSGKMTPLEKANRIARIDELQKAVKQARMRANATEAEKRTIGREILDFINSTT